MHGYTSVTLEVAGRRTDEDEDRESERCLTENPFSKNMEKKKISSFFLPRTCVVTLPLLLASLGRCGFFCP